MVSPQRPFAKTANSLRAYLAEVRRKPVPTHEEEVTLGRRIGHGDEQARHELIERNLRFVVQVAGKYKGYGLPLSDLINEGNLGLMHAARKFDPERGVRFVTYAAWWIRQAIVHALMEGANAVRLPLNQAETLLKLRHKFEELRQQDGVEPSAEDLAQVLQMQPQKVEDLLRAYRPQLSLDAPIQNDSDTTQLDFIQSGNSPSLEEDFFHSSMLHEVHDLLNHLDSREANILRARFGFDGNPQSLAAIGRELGLSRERVRQIEARARNKLRIMAK